MNDIHSLLITGVNAGGGVILKCIMLRDVSNVLTPFKKCKNGQNIRNTIAELSYL